MIKWNEVTWYSRLGALILFLGVVPALCFYIGMEYQLMASSQANQVQTIVTLNSTQQPQISFSKIAFTDLMQKSYSFGGSSIDVLYQTNQFSRDEIVFSYNGVSYRLISNDVSPTGRQAPALFAHKIQYLDPATNGWIDVGGQSKLGQGFTENIGLTVVAYDGSLFILSSARQGFHYNELLGILGTSIISYKKITGQNMMGIVADESGVYLQVDDSLCSDPGVGAATCPQYYQFKNDGNLPLVKVQLDDPFLQRQG